MPLSDYYKTIVSAVLVIVITGCVISLKVLAGDEFVLEEQVSEFQMFEQATLLPIAQPPQPRVVKRVNVVVTAYSSTVEETDDTPFITASGEWVEDGIVANNLLSFGTQIRLPEIFGDKIFIVKDRMNSRKSNYHVDIWFSSKTEAIKFGAINATMEILR